MGRKLEQSMPLEAAEALPSSDLQEESLRRKGKKKNKQVSAVPVSLDLQVNRPDDDEKEPRKKRKVEEDVSVGAGVNSGHEHYNGDDKRNKKKKKNKERNKEPRASEEFDVSNENGIQESGGAGEIVDEDEINNKKHKKDRRLNSDEFEANCNNGKKTAEAWGNEKPTAAVSVPNGEKEKKNGKNAAEIFEAKGVVVSGNDTKDLKYAALKSFAESGLPADVLECCKNFNKPSPIQSHAWPFLLSGRDFIGIAGTGSGTLLFFS